MPPGYVCAFRGRRDYYQVPIALAESRELNQLITDAYALPWVKAIAKAAPGTFSNLVHFRCDSAIPDDRVRCLWGTTAVEHLRHKAGFSRTLTFGKLDRQYALAAAHRARQTRSDLLLYSSYAWEAFRAGFSHTPRRVLFQYHPHCIAENRIIQEDRQRYPDLRFEPAGNDLPESLIQRERDCWKFADLILCASSFTKRTLLEAGAKEEICRVVPYGIDLPGKLEAACEPSDFHALFVGGGWQRKGLHHLLTAWRRANLPNTSRLTVVCREIDPQLETLALAVPRVQLLRGVSGTKLHELFASSTVFVMPSLVEGFGQVYLEALAQGCPVLGTENTALPDLGDESNGVFVTPCGNIDALAARLEMLAQVLPGNESLRRACRDRAAEFPWSRFRQNLRKQLSA